MVLMKPGFSNKSAKILIYQLKLAPFMSVCIFQALKLLVFCGKLFGMHNRLSQYVAILRWFVV